MQCKLQVGQKVVCVDDEFTSPQFTGQLVAGATYTIAELIPCKGFRCAPRYRWCTVAVILAEVPRWIFAHARFRPAEPRRTDISVFTRMLNKTPEPAV